MTAASINSLFSLDDKICLVTAGSRGLGYQMAQGFLEAKAACEAAAASLSDYGECLALPGDVSSVRNNDRARQSEQSPVRR